MSEQREPPKLTDTYVKAQITKRSCCLVFSDIPDELVAAKREQIKVFRLIKEMERENTKNT